MTVTTATATMITKETKDQHLTVRLPSRLLARIRNVTDEETPVGQFLRLAALREVERREKRGRR